MKRVMHIGDEVFVHGYVDEIRNDTIIIRNAGGYFGTSRDEVCYEDDGYGTMNEADRKTEPQKKEVEWVYNKRERLWYPYSNGELLFKDKPTTQTETQNSNLTFCVSVLASALEDESQTEYKKYLEKIKSHDPHKDW